MRRAATLGLVLALALSLPAAAVARVVAPPGNSEADQYFETVPGSAGPRTPDATRDEGDAVREGSLTAATGGALRRSGAAGEAVVRAVARTAPAGGRAGGSSSSAPQAPPLGSPGLGAAFPLALVAAAAAAVAFAAGRRRRPTAR